MLNKYLDILREILIPNAILDSLDDIPVDDLYQKGFRTFFLDVDNTLMTYGQHRVSLQNHQWVEYARSLGFAVYLVSNNSSHRRIARVGDQLGVKGVFFAMKPLPFSVQELARDAGIDFKTSVFVGDKLLTDVIVGNWLEAYTILVDPLDKKESFIRTVQRDVELFLLNKLRKGLS